VEHGYHPTLQALTIDTSISRVDCLVSLVTQTGTYIDWNIYIPAGAVKAPLGHLASPSLCSVRPPFTGFGTGSNGHAPTDGPLSAQNVIPADGLPARCDVLMSMPTGTFRVECPP
jgi:hypothetical protein